MLYPRRVFVATSLDGFIARTDGSLDWLEEANRSVPSSENCGYAEFMSGVDAIIMGRKTFELVTTFTPWPYEGKHVYVLSHSLTELPQNTPTSVTLASGTPQEIVAIAEGNQHYSLYIDGGQTIQEFLRAGLITELIVTTIPVLLGEGRPLFGTLSADIKLRHVSTLSYPFGFVQSRYTIAKDT